jgi:hypothetical protein
MLQGFNCLVYRQLFTHFMVVTTILFVHTTFLRATYGFWQQIAPFDLLGHTDFDWRFLRLILGARRLRPVGSGCLLLHGTWSLLQYTCIQMSVYAHSLICIWDWLIFVIFVISWSNLNGISCQNIKKIISKTDGCSELELFYDWYAQWSLKCNLHNSLNFKCFDIKKFRHELGHTCVRNFSNLHVLVWIYTNNGNIYGNLVILHGCGQVKTYLMLRSLRSNDQGQKLPIR